MIKIERLLCDFCEDCSTVRSKVEINGKIFFLCHDCEKNTDEDIEEKLSKK